MAAITFEHVTKEFGAGTASDKVAVHDITLDVEKGAFVVLLGPSGSGKTTLMRMVNRLIEPTSGKILVNGREVHQQSMTDLRRHIGYVIQQVGLFPHMNVEDNIATVPKLLGWDRKRIDSRIDELLNLVALPPAEYRKRYPRQLSGGQQQRIGIARAMAADPPIMLMDEPFGAIDAITRHDLQTELLEIQRQVEKTVLFVTHDVDEALRLADRIVVMRDGGIVQYDTPLNILNRPADPFVETLLGTDDVFRRLSLLPVTSLMEPIDGSSNGSGVSIQEDQDVRTALSALISSKQQMLTVVNGDDQPIGRLSMATILSRGAGSNGKG